jgi:gamma-glutamyltranspeptidase / glutathione hydrolase
MRAGVAAGHPATAEAGLEILKEGGTAADAAVAASLASCVAETVMTGFLGGGHALWWDGRQARLLDCFVAVPSRVGEMQALPVPFGEEIVHYAIGPASCAVPGLPAGLEALWRTGGRLPWARLVEPALRLARSGVDLPPAHAACLAMLEPVMTLGRGGEIYAPGGRLLGTGDRLGQPGLVAALEAVAAEGPGTVYDGTIAEALTALDGVAVTRADLRSYGVRWEEPVEADWAGVRFRTRGGLSGVPELLGRLPSLRGADERERVLRFLAVLDGAERPGGDTTNLVAVDAEGRACVLTSSLGLGSGDFLPGLDLHLNSMLGEVDLVLEPLVPGERMASMMAPTLASDADGPVLAIGSAGGTRLRTALVGVAAGILDEGLEPAAAVERPRFHPAGAIVNAEPGVDEDALGEVEATGRTVRRWPAPHHYFGGVSLVSRRGLAADPRRSGAALEL